ncbi:MAG: hypothetical protein JRC86_05495 [Deltaproteobacteria bacterium]|nr:hypothetical protein [Deltaproteobacteria bacterium]
MHKQDYSGPVDGYECHLSECGFCNFHEKIEILEQAYRYMKAAWKLMHQAEWLTDDGSNKSPLFSMKSWLYRDKAAALYAQAASLNRC